MTQAGRYEPAKVSVSTRLSGVAGFEWSVGVKAKFQKVHGKGFLGPVTVKGRSSLANEMVWELLRPSRQALVIIDLLSAAPVEDAELSFIQNLLRAKEIRHSLHHGGHEAQIALDVKSQAQLDAVLKWWWYQEFDESSDFESISCYSVQNFEIFAGQGVSLSKLQDDMDEIVTLYDLHRGHVLAPLCDRLIVDSSKGTADGLLIFCHDEIAAEQTVNFIREFWSSRGIKVTGA